MAKQEDKLPVYDDRVKEILRGLTEGKTRDLLSEELGYSTWKSLDIYMRRKNFVWDGKQQNYVPTTSRADGLMDDLSTAPPKISLIISLFRQEAADPRAIARQVGFSDHREMAEYLKTKGYVWSSEEGNYVEFVGKINELDELPKESNSDDINLELREKKVISFPSDRTAKSEDCISLERYLSILEILERNKERLVDLLMPASTVGTLPRYAVPGTTKTKSIYMSELLSRLVGEFSESKNVSQREIVEAALVEYMKRYGFEREIAVLLKKA